jgi:hypothetical protein
LATSWLHDLIYKFYLDLGVKIYLGVKSWTLLKEITPRYINAMLESPYRVPSRIRMMNAFVFKKVNAFNNMLNTAVLLQTGQFTAPSREL